MNLSKQQTKMLQGIAILCMLGFHLFNRTHTDSYYDLYLKVGEYLY